MPIVQVLVDLENPMPEQMLGLCRASNVQALDDDDENVEEDLCDAIVGQNRAFHTHGELVRYVASELRVDASIVEIDAADDF